MKAFATLLLAVGAPVASAQSYSYSYFYESVTFAPSAAPSVSPTGVPVPAPTQSCYDTSATDSWGDSCDWYTSSWSCTSGYYDDDDFTAEDLCCTCILTPTASPTTTVTYSNGCSNTNAGATDPFGDGCLDYDSSTSWCGNYNDDDFSSDEMCCGCIHAPTVSPTVSLAPTPAPVPAPTASWELGCANTDGDAADIDGDSCWVYEYYPSFCGGFYDDEDFSSDDMCCVCGGGMETASIPDVVLAVSLTVTMDCADYGTDEQAVFAAAMQATISGSSVEAGDCTQTSRRRNLLQSSEATLDFTVTVSGEAALSATATSIATVVNAAVTGTAFAAALASAITALGYTGSVIPADGSIPISGATAVSAPTSAPVSAPTAAPPAPTASVVIESGSWRSAPGMGLLGTCIAALAAAWI